MNFITLDEYRKRRVRRSREQKFRGWVHVHSKTGSDWGDYGKWEFISGPYSSKELAIKAMKGWRHDDCCPCNVVALYW